MLRFSKEFKDGIEIAIERNNENDFRRDTSRVAYKNSSFTDRGTILQLAY